MEKQKQVEQVVKLHIIIMIIIIMKTIMIIVMEKIVFYYLVLQMKMLKEMNLQKLI